MALEIGEVIGGKVIDGTVKSDSLIEVIRNKEKITSGKLTRLQAGKQDVTSCEKDQECGIQYVGPPDIIEGDILNFYKEEKIIDKV